MNRHGIACILFALASAATAADKEVKFREIGERNCRAVIPDERTARAVKWSGACKDGYAEGNGMLQWRHPTEPHDSLYEGELRRGQRHGSGYLKLGNGTTQYEGSFSEGRYEGTGTLVDTEGRYDGEWKADKREGAGKMSYLLGGSYEGQWKADKFHGKGTVSYAGGRTVTAEFVEGRRIGQAAVPTPSSKTFHLKGDIRPMGFIPPNVASSPSIPFSRSYDEMNPSEREAVRQLYVLDDDDEPPYPANGTRKLYDLIAKAQQVRLVSGRLRMNVAIDSAGNPTAVTVYQTPEPQIATWAAAVLMKEKYKPGVCQGKPCPMIFPVSVEFAVD